MLPHFSSDDSNKKLRILLVTSDLPSHTYALAKLAKILAKRGHSAELAAPAGSALDRVRSETKGTLVTCVECGNVTTKKHMSERPVLDPNAWSTLWKALRKPFPLPDACNIMMDEQEGMYEPIKKMISSHAAYDVVIPIHSACATVCDAVESVDPNIPVIIFSSLPYDPSFYLGEAETWSMTRSITALPHVGAYASNQLAASKSWMDTLFITPVTLVWKAVDALICSIQWRASAGHNNARRARRGLGPMPDGWRGYLQKYPGISLGGVSPFMASDNKVSDHVTVVGTLDPPSGENKSLSAVAEMDPDLAEWVLQQQGEEATGIVYVSFGTGTILSDDEAANVTGNLAHSLARVSNLKIPILIAMRQSQQDRLRKVIDDAVGSPPCKQAPGILEYLGGRLRLQDCTPQAQLLVSGHVKVFVSHMGMGGFVEGVRGGVNFVCYPSGLDQWYNAQRCVEAGLGVHATKGLGKLGEEVWAIWQDAKAAARARDTAAELEDLRGDERAICAIEKVARKRNELVPSSKEEEPKDTFIPASTARNRYLVFFAQYLLWWNNASKQPARKCCRFEAYSILVSVRLVMMM